MQQRGELCSLNCVAAVPWVSLSWGCNCAPHLAGLELCYLVSAVQSPAQHCVGAPRQSTAVQCCASVHLLPAVPMHPPSQSTG